LRKRFRLPRTLLRSAKSNLGVPRTRLSASRTKLRYLRNLVPTPHTKLLKGRIYVAALQPT
jgi:hypothetical protein